MSRNTENKPSKMNWNTLLRLWRYIYDYKSLLFMALFLTLSSNLFALVGPMLSGYAIDAIEPGKGLVVFERVFYYCGLMIVFYVLSSALSYALALIMIQLSQKIVYKMRKDVFEKLASLPVGYFDRYQAGDIISRITYDIDTINTSLSNDLIQICTSIVTVGGSLIMMLSISPVLVLIFAVTIPISIYFTKRMTGKVRPLFRKRSAKLGELNGYVEEVLSGQKSIKAYHREEVFVQRFDKRNKEAVEAYYDSEYYGSIVMPFVNFINNLSMSLVSVFGALLFLFGRMSLGSVSSFVLYSRKFSGPINETANIISELQSAFAAAERVFRILDESPEPLDKEGAHVYSDVEGNLSMKEVSFGYTPDKIILKKLSLHAQKGNLVAIVGPTGAGKTTIINLLMRFYDPSSGRIELDGTDLRDATRESLRRSYAMVLQDTWLFHGTLFDNIAYGREDATREEVVAAAKAAKIHGYIVKLPQGYDTVLSEEGMNISQGQKQLITIARAMLTKAPMLILDEATSNVDTQTEVRIQAAMRNLMKDKTCFVIAHRLSTIQNADTILVLKDGDIVEQGNHDELLTLGGLYSELYYSQFENA